MFVQPTQLDTAGPTNRSLSRRVSSRVIPSALNKFQPHLRLPSVSDSVSALGLASLEDVVACSYGTAFTSGIVLNVTGDDIDLNVVAQSCKGVQ